MDPKSDDSKPLPETSAKSPSMIWRFLYVLTKWKWFLMASFVGIMVVMTVLILLIPRYYKAEATVLPPKNRSLLGSLSGASSLLHNLSPLLGTSSLGGTSPTYTYLAILSSRTVMDSVINKFNLIKVYKIKRYPMMMAEKELRKNSNFQVDENDALDITVMDKNARRAASMANYFIRLLNETYIRVSVEEAHNNKVFIQQQYLQNMSDLRAAEDTLEAFEQHYKVYDMPQQAKAAITAGADLEAQRMAAQVELGVLKAQFGNDAPQVRLKSLQIQELGRELNNLQNGDGTALGGDASVLPAFKNVPSLGIAFLRLYRNYEIQTRLLEFIVPMYEQAKIEEQKDTPAVIVLDQAIPPEKPTVPNRLFLEVVFAFVFLSLLIYFVHVLERVREQRDSLNPLETRLLHFSDFVVRRFRVREKGI